jgi:UDP-N-acetylglucosamine transferase subunit ALG13
LIFATIGTQLPFPRLILALDEMAPSLGEKIIAQTGKIDKPLRNIEHYESIAPQEFEDLFREARVVVAHAGIGTVIAAKKFSKPIILFPRKAVFGEHRNDHQLASANQLKNHSGVYIAWDEADLKRLLASELTAPALVEGEALLRLRQRIGQFIEGSAAR